jgi:hypothetical protein
MESGMDVSASDLGFVECQNGHTFLENLKLNSDKELDIDDYRKWLKNYSKNSKYYKDEIEENIDLPDDEFLEYFEENWLSGMEDEGINPEFCPVCQFEDLPYEDVAKWFLIKEGLSRKEFAQQMKNEFKNYNDFKEVLKGSKK